MVFVKYCSGDLHSGLMQTASNQTFGLQFSGFQIVTAVLRTLLPNMSSAELVIWSGDSAGGLGCFITLDAVGDWLRAHVPRAELLGAPIGGFYFSNDNPYSGPTPAPVQYIPWSYTALQQYQALWHAFVPTRCASQPANADQPWVCLFAAASYPSLQSPVFITEAQTDMVYNQQY